VIIFLSLLLLRVPLVYCTLPFHPFYLQTLLLSFLLSLSAYYSCTRPSLCNLRLSVHSHISLVLSLPLLVPSIPRSPYINILSIMLSNIIILLLKSPPHFLSPTPHTHSTTFIISLICAFR
jgi:hypothetical protein